MAEVTGVLESSIELEFIKKNVSQNNTPDSF